MRTLLLLLLASPLWSASQKYNHRPAILNDEVENIYRTMKKPIDPLTISSMTVSSLTVTSFFRTPGAILQVVSSQTTVINTVAGVTPEDTGLFAYITPKSSSSMIAVFVEQNCETPDANFQMIQLSRNTTELPATIVCTNNSTGGSITLSAPLFYLDTEHGVQDTQIYYKTTHTREGGTGTVQVQDLDNGQPGRSTMILVEIEQ